MRVLGALWEKDPPTSPPPLPPCSWDAAARAYLDAGAAFLRACMHTGEVDRAGVQGMDGARRALEAQDGTYNAVLDALEVGCWRRWVRWGCGAGGAGCACVLPSAPPLG